MPGINESRLAEPHNESWKSKPASSPEGCCRSSRSIPIRLTLLKKCFPRDGSSTKRPQHGEQTSCRKSQREPAPVDDFINAEQIIDGANLIASLLALRQPASQKSPAARRMTSRCRANSTSPGCRL